MKDLGIGRDLRPAPRRWRRSTVTVVVGCVVVAASFVAAGAALWVHGGRDGYLADGPVLATDIGWRGQRSSMQMFVGGDLKLDDGCLRLGDSTTAIVWPSGTRWDEGERAVVLADGTTIRIGDALEAGGGMIHEGSDPAFERSAVGRLTLPCRGADGRVLELAEDLDDFEVVG